MTASFLRVMKIFHHLEELEHSRKMISKPNWVFPLCICVLYGWRCSGFYQFSLSNRVPSVVNTPWKRFQVFSWIYCLRECSASSECVAYALDSGSKACELYSCGYQDQCMAEKLLSVDPGLLFHQMKQTKVTQRLCRFRNIHAFHSLPDLMLNISACNKVTIYGDGVKLGEASGAWQNATVIGIPAGTRVISLRGECDTNENCGIIGSLSNGAVTDSSWKCNTEGPTGWKGVQFDDSSWPAAEKYVNGRKSCSGAVGGVHIQASWIWTKDDKYDERVYCRLRL